MDGSSFVEKLFVQFLREIHELFLVKILFCYIAGKLLLGKAFFLTLKIVLAGVVEAPFISLVTRHFRGII